MMVMVMKNGVYQNDGGKADGGGWIKRDKGNKVGKYNCKNFRRNCLHCIIFTSVLL